MSGHHTKDIPRWFAPGTIIDGRYEIKELIGKGGVARVYRCVQLDIGREVALKVVSPDASRSARQLCERRLVNEALTTARIHHPNVINIRGLGRQIHAQIDGEEEIYKRPYLVMECLQGHTLSEHLNHHGPLHPRRALPLFLDVIDALAVGHEHEIIHKDLKPDNLFMTWPDLPREALILLDYGIARAEKVLTVDGSVPCTVNYVAPEYIENHIVTPAIDVYQIALVLIETLTGSPVVDSDYVTRCIAMHINGNLNVPQSIVDSPLWPVLSRALERDYKRRIPNAAALYSELSKIDPADIHLPETPRSEDDDLLFFSEDTDDYPTHPDGIINSGTH